MAVGRLPPASILRTPEAELMQDVLSDTCGVGVVPFPATVIKLKRGPAGEYRSTEDWRDIVKRRHLANAKERQRQLESGVPTEGRDSVTCAVPGSSLPPPQPGSVFIRAPGPLTELEGHALRLRSCALPTYIIQIQPDRSLVGKIN
ncbi:UNVERIFIED_CONTAM: hypothetical protein FKN15_031380 [Acipenser sinensis]